MKNISFFFKEMLSLTRKEPLAHGLAILSTAMITTLVAFTLVVSFLSSEWVALLTEEATFHVFFDEDRPVKREDVLSLDGVEEASLITAREAAVKMRTFLGEDEAILSLLDDNPFQAYLEVEIQLDKRDVLFDQIAQLEGVTSLRDNRQALELIASTATTLDRLSTVLIAGVVLVAVVLISHLIRVGFHDHKETIETLRLFGAPEGFIALPFFLDALLVTLSGTVLALLFTQGVGRHLLERGLGPLPFVPPQVFRASFSSLWIPLFSLTLPLALAASVFGYMTAKKD